MENQVNTEKFLSCVLKHERKKAIEKFMFDTYAKAKELNCSINVNAKTKKMSWEDFG